MRVLVTGHNGYIGSVLVPMLQEAEHEVTGLDNYLYGDCTFGDDVVDPPSLRMDIRDVEATDLEGFDAVMHLAAISNDPVGDLNADTTYDINYRAAVRIASLAKQARVPAVHAGIGLVHAFPARVSHLDGAEHRLDVASEDDADLGRAGAQDGVRARFESHR